MLENQARPFLRVPIDTTAGRWGDGYFLKPMAAAALVAGEPVVVTTGSGLLLLAHEINPSTEAED